MAQPCPPCLALNDLPVRGLAWRWPVSPVSLRASSPFRRQGRGLGLPLSGWDSRSWGCTRKMPPWKDPSQAHAPSSPCWGEGERNEAIAGLGSAPRTESHCPFPPGPKFPRPPHPHPQGPTFPDCGQGLGLSSGSLLPCPARGGVSRRQAGLQVWGLEGGGAQQLVFEVAPSSLPFPLSLLPVIPVSTRGGGGTGSRGSRKRD